MSNRKRNVRVPEPLREPSERHKKILLALESYNHLDTKHLALITGLSLDNLEEPARKLFHSGLVDRPSNNLYRRDRLNDPIVHKRNDVGTDWLERHELVPPRAIYTGRGGQPPHDLAVSQLMACIKLAHDAAGLRFYTADEILAQAPEETQKLETPFRFETGFGHVIPDAVFATGYGDDEFRISFVEVNLSDHGEKAYKRKAEAYRDLIFAGIYKKQLGMKQYARVLTFDTSKATTAAMLKHTEKRDKSCFKYIPDYGRFEAAPPPVQNILENWRTPTNHSITLEEVN
jgi:hypothetical protein